MNRIVIFIALVLTSTSAVAKWAQVNINNKAILMVNEASIEKRGDIVKMNYYFAPTDINLRNWVLIKSQSEFDCKKNRIRIISGALFANIDISNFDRLDGEWIKVSDDQGEQFLLDFVCQGKYK